jgi:hypothetical protein
MMRNRPYATALLMAAVLGVLPAPHAGARTPNPDSPVLAISPSATGVPADVAVTGSCPPIDESYPSSTSLTFPAAGVESQEIPLDSGGEFVEPFVASLPEGLTPGAYVATTSCEGSAGVRVLPPDVPATLSLDRDSGDVGETVTATGTCPTSSQAVELFFDDLLVGRATADGSTGAFGPVDFAVPQVAAGSHDVTTGCGGSASFEVLLPEIRPTLSLDPVSGNVGDDVTAAGTCPLSSEGVILFFGDERVGSAEVDAETGAFAVVFPVPTVEGGAARVTTDCGGAADFTVTVRQQQGPPVLPGTTVDPGTSVPPGTTVAPGTTAAPGTTVAPRTTAAPGTTAAPRTTAAPSATAAPTRVPPTDRPPTTATQVSTPEGPKIVVPELTGMTEDEAIAALGDSLVLANPTGHNGHVRRQVPAAGTLVEPASAVTVVLAAGSRASFLPVLLIAALVLAIAAATVVSQRARRRRTRERRWVDEQVRTDLQVETPALSPVPDVAVPGIEIRLEVHRHPTRL